jgi:hypothetical protein
MNTTAAQRNRVRSGVDSRAAMLGQPFFQESLFKAEGRD